MKRAGPIRIGLAGLGGYAGIICDRIFEQSRAINPSVHFVGVCDPQIERFASRTRDLHKVGIKTVSSFEQLLNLDLEAVWLPLPIDLHRSFTEAALAAGKAVMCEKPAAGSIDDVDAMLAARDRAKQPVLIGFQDIYQPAVATLKQRLVSGEFGKTISTTVIGCWPRSQRYFGRNEWAGRFRREGRWVMDSPASNALAHFINLAMFLSGKDLITSASPTHVAAELYRANRIENFDTCSLRLTLPGDIPLLVAYTHACQITIEPIITIETQRGVIRYIAGRHIEIRTGAHVEILPLDPHPHVHMLRAFQHCLREDPTSVMCATLEMARSHVVAMNVVSESTPIHDIPAAFIETITGPDQGPLRAVQDIVPAMQQAISQKRMLHETGLMPWSVSANQTKVPRDYKHFAGPHPPRPALAISAQLPHLQSAQRSAMPAH